MLRAQSRIGRVAIIALACTAALTGIAAVWNGEADKPTRSSIANRVLAEAICKSPDGVRFRTENKGTVTVKDRETVTSEGQRFRLSIGDTNLIDGATEVSLTEIGGDRKEGAPKKVSECEK